MLERLKLKCVLVSCSLAFFCMSPKALQQWLQGTAADISYLFFCSCSWSCSCSCSCLSSSFVHDVFSRVSIEWVVSVLFLAAWRCSSSKYPLLFFLMVLYVLV